jgi:hypothetical protein
MRARNGMRIATASQNLHSFWPCDRIMLLWKGFKPLPCITLPHSHCTLRPSHTTRTNMRTSIVVAAVALLRASLWCGMAVLAGDRMTLIECSQSHCFAGL